MKRLTTKRTDGRWALIVHKGTRPLDNIPMAIDKLAEYENLEEQGLLVRLIAPNGCGFCRGVQIMSGNFEGSFSLDEHHNEAIQTDDITDFHFCPMCGRPLVSRAEAEATLAKGG